MKILSTNLSNGSHSLHLGVTDWLLTVTLIKAIFVPCAGPHLDY